MAERLQVREGDLLLALDIQNDFFSNGTLPIPGAESIVPIVNRLLEMLPRGVLSLKWHPRGHASFASHYPGRRPFETIPSPTGEQMLWTEHCLAGRNGAEMHPSLNTSRVEMVLRRGTQAGLYVTSALMADDGRTSTGLLGYLKERKVRRLLLAGFLLDFSIRATAQDARKSGLEVVVIEDAVRGLNVRGSLEHAWLTLAEIGARRVMSESLVLS
jgi:nicotinamidase/pyrazinamidase